MGNYFLRKGTGKEATLFTRIRKRVPYIDKNVNTRIVISRDVWERANRDAASLEKFYRTKDGQILYQKMCAIDQVLDELLSQGKFDDEHIDKAVESVVFAEIRERQRQEEEEQQAIQHEEEENRRKDVRAFLQNFIAGIKEGTIKHNGNTYGANTCKVWTSFQRVLERFYKKHPFTWEDIDKGLVDKFLYMLEKEEYMPKTINKYLVCFRTMVGYAHRARLHNNLLADKCFTKIRVRECDKVKEIYLTADELQALYEMPLTGLEAEVRDVFLIGCYTCQRFSDYSVLRPDNFTTTSRGTKIVRLIQQKTNTPVVVPILNDNLLRIAERYDFEIPTVSDVILNRYIKMILKRLSESVPSLAETEVTKLTMKEREKEARGEAEFMRNEYGDVIKCRYDLVTSHTARRSGITNLYLTGLFDTVQMMSISGHKDQRTFFDYIKLSSDEIADRIMDKLRQSEQASNETLF
ncbi:MAG: phage integrase SAM-like domain-containing protein [Ruminococcus sp.]|nr:phage integrase SAM-like domain-containing protein [Ruminococcus sp.]